MDKVFAVQNFGSSGTILLQSLFDGHPQILSMPALNARDLLAFWESHEYSDEKELIHDFLEQYNFLFCKTDWGDFFGLTDMGPGKNEIACVDKELFTQYLTEEWQKNSPLKRKKFLLSVYKAYNKALGRTIDENGYLLFPIHCQDERFAHQLAEDFKEVKFIHMIREPIQNAGSLASHISKSGHWRNMYLLSCTIGQIFCDHCLHIDMPKAHGIIPYVPDQADGSIQTRVVRLEDIHKNARGTLTKICNWLGIEWHDTLLESTFDGKLWHNRPETIRQTGIGTQIIAQKYSGMLSRFDKYRLEHLANPFKQFYNYSEKKHSKLMTYLLPILLILPFRMEFKRWHMNHLIEYIKCRLKWLFPAWKKTFKPYNYIEML